MARPDLSRSLRRAADRPAGSRNKAPNPGLVAAAQAGLLTATNTAKGSAGRKAVDAVEYRRRRRRHADEPARAALGHRAPDDRTAVWSVLYADDPPRILYDAVVARRDARRVARHLGLLAQLAEARTPERARHAAGRLRRVRTWRPLTVLGPPELAGEVRFLADPEAALALIEIVRAEDAEVAVSYGRSARRRGRT
jgi:hypothetical protein